MCNTEALRKGFFFYLAIVPNANRAIKSFPFEALIWFSGLVVLFLYQPGDDHFSLCPLYNLGFEYCPGCGLGRSISHFLHGEISQSLRMHPLGIFAVFVLSLRIIKLLKQYLQLHGKNN